MNVMRYLKGNLSIRYHPWNEWLCFGVDKYWSGRLIYINISKFVIHLDCRVNWLNDMVTGKIE